MTKADNQNGQTPALQRVGVLGGGAWGTALAQSARRAGRDVTLWAYESETVSEINAHHTNKVYLPGVALDPAIKATAKAKDLAAADVLLLVAPASSSVRSPKTSRRIWKPESRS